MEGENLAEIDRALYNVRFQRLYTLTTLTHLPRISSDHSSLLIRLANVISGTSNGFVFQRMWVDHPYFMNIVAQDWARPVVGPPGKVLHRKLIRLRKKLKEWNWNSFGNIFTRKKELQDLIQNLKTQHQQGGDRFRALGVGRQSKGIDQSGSLGERDVM